MEPTEQQTYRKSMDERFDRQDDKLDQILTQTTKTNGRVSALENRQDKSDLRYAYIQGALAVIGVLMTTLLLPLSFMAIQYALR